MAETYSVEAYLRATGADQFSRSFQNASRDVQGLERSSGTASVTVGGMLKALAGTAAAVAGINMLKNSLDGAITRYDTLNTFPRVLELMGFDADSSAKAINTLSDGITGLPTTLDDVASTTQRIAGMTGDLDGAVATTLALNNAFLASGSSGGDASRGLAQYVQMLAKGEVDMQSWRSLQETMPIALVRTAEAFGFAGASAQNDLYDALKDGDVTFAQFNDKIIELSNATGGFADMAKESSTGIRTSWSNMKTTIVRNVANMIGAIDEALGGVGSIAGIIDKMKDAIQKAFQYVIANVPKVFSTLQQIAEAIRPWLPLITAVFAAFITFNTVVSVIAKVKAAIIGLKVAFAAMNVVILANPFALIIAAIVAAAILVYVYWEPISAFFVKLWGIIKESGIAVWEWLKGVWSDSVAWLKEAWSSVTQFFSSMWNDIKTDAMAIWDAVAEKWQSTVQSVKDIWGAVKEFFTSLWTDTSNSAISAWDSVVAKWNAVVGIVTTIFGPMIEFFSTTWTTISTMAITIFGNISTALSGIWTNIQTIASAAWEIIKNVVLAPILLLINLVQGDMEEFSVNLAAIWTNISTAAGEIWEALKNIVTTVVTTMISIITTLLSGFISIITGYFTAFKATVSNLWNAITTFISTQMLAIRQTITTTWNNIKTFFVTTLAAIVKFVTQYFQNMKTSANQKVSETKNDIRTAWDNIKQSIRDALISIVTNISNKFIELKNSIRQKMRDAKTTITTTWKTVMTFFQNIDLLQIGKDIIQGLINGITAKVKAVTDAVKNVADAITGKIKSILNIKSPSRVFKGFGGFISEGLAIGINEEARTAVKAAAALGKSVTDAFTPNLSMDALAMPNANIASDIGAVHRSSKKQMQFDYSNELNINKQPARITVVLGNQEFERFVEDINEVNTVNDLARRF